MKVAIIPGNGAGNVHRCAGKKVLCLHGASATAHPWWSGSSTVAAVMVVVMRWQWLLLLWWRCALMHASVCVW